MPYLHACSIGCSSLKSSLTREQACVSNCQDKGCAGRGVGYISKFVTRADDKLHQGACHKVHGALRRHEKPFSKIKATCYPSFAGS